MKIRKYWINAVLVRIYENNKFFDNFFNKIFLFYQQQGIDSLFKKINCDSSQIEMLLLNKEGVTESNMSQYLGIIDSRTDELLKWQSILSARVSLISL